MAANLPLIAVIDDEKPVRTMLRRVLRLADYDVAEFASGEDFLRALSSTTPRCAILDVHMPGMSGFDVEAGLREAHADVPVVFITASDDAQLDRAASAAGAVCLLRKPFTTEALLAAVRAAIRT